MADTLPLRRYENPSARRLYGSLSMALAGVTFTYLAIEIASARARDAAIEAIMRQKLHVLAHPRAQSEVSDGYMITTVEFHDGTTSAYYHDQPDLPDQPNRLRVEGRDFLIVDNLVSGMNTDLCERGQSAWTDTFYLAAHGDTTSWSGLQHCVVRIDGSMMDPDDIENQVIDAFLVLGINRHVERVLGGLNNHLQLCYKYDGEC